MNPTKTKKSTINEFQFSSAFLKRAQGNVYIDAVRICKSICGRESESERERERERAKV